MILGVDLRCLPMDGSEGAGIAHVARLLYPFLIHEGKQRGIQVVGLAPKGASIEAPESIIWLKNQSGGSLRYALMTHKIDTLFIPSGAVATGITVPVYPLVHDIDIFDHPKWFPQSFLKRLLTTSLFQMGLNKAKHIFVVSRHTKQALEKRLAIKSDKISVVYQGNQVTHLQWNPDKVHPYALMIGTVEPRKNYAFIFDIWKKRAGDKPFLDLRLVGKNGWGNIQLPNAKWFFHYNQAMENEKNDLLEKASMVLLPSLSEGFGRVALEAMAAGVPLITSSQGSLPEIVQNGGTICELNPSLWEKEIDKIMNNHEYVQNLSERAKQRAIMFSWENMANDILAKIEST